MYVNVPVIEKLSACISLAYNVFSIVTFPPTFKLEFIETSLTIVVVPETYNLLFKSVSLATDNFELKNASL